MNNMSNMELLRSVFLGFMFGLLYVSGMPVELLIILGLVILLFMAFRNKIKPIIDNLFEHVEILSKIPLQYRPIVTFFFLLVIFIIIKQIIYFMLSYFFGIELNIESYLNTTLKN